MPNELAHEITTEAMNDFNRIDSNHDGTLNLLDIMNYQKLGPEQKKVGQFLQDHFDAIRNIGDFRGEWDENPQVNITKEDLLYVNELSSSDPTVVNSRLNQDKLWEGVVGTVDGAFLGVLPAGASMIGTAWLGAGALVVGAGVEGTATVGYAALHVNDVDKYDRANIANISKMTE
jgi:hypothetical protein